MRYVFLLSVVCCACLGSEWACSLDPSPPFHAYDVLSWTLSSDKQIESPYNYSQISISAFFRLGCDTVRVDPFWYEGYTRRERWGNEYLEPSGEGHFSVRFSPPKSGTYNFQLRDRDNVVCEENIVVTTPSGQSRVHISSDNQRFDDVYLLGLNMCWSGSSRKTYDYDDWLPRLAENGGNYIRLWSADEDLFALERSRVGEYDQKSAWRLDYVLSASRALDIYAEFCIESFNGLRSTSPYDKWDSYPYNTKNGGMIDHPWLFFTDKLARSAFQNRLRYIIARYASFSSVLGWQLWNEVDITTGYDSSNVFTWHKEMIKYIHRVDTSARHPVSTSFSNSAGSYDIQNEVDYVSTHSYGMVDVAANILFWDDSKWGMFKKPHFVEEFGIGNWNKSIHQDPTGISLHNALWSGLSSVSAGAPAIWWWDNYISPMNLFHVFKSVSVFSNLTLRGMQSWEKCDGSAAEEALRVCCLKSTDSNKAVNSLVWLRNSEHTWYNVYHGVPVPSIPQCNVTLTMFPEHASCSSARVIRFDTYTAESSFVGVLPIVGGNITLLNPAMDKDVAYSISLENCNE